MGRDKEKDKINEKYHMATNLELESNVMVVGHATVFNQWRLLGYMEVQENMTRRVCTTGWEGYVCGNNQDSNKPII